MSHDINEPLELDNENQVDFVVHLASNTHPVAYATDPKIIADFAGKEVIFELPDETEKAGYSKATKARLDGSKLKKLGWKARYDIKQGLERTMKMLIEIQNEI